MFQIEKRRQARRKEAVCRSGGSQTRARIYICWYWARRCLPNEDLGKGKCKLFEGLQEKIWGQSKKVGQAEYGGSWILWQRGETHFEEPRRNEQENRMEKICYRENLLWKKETWLGEIHKETGVTTWVRGMRSQLGRGEERRKQTEEGI